MPSWGKPSGDEDGQAHALRKHPLDTSRAIIAKGQSPSPQSNYPAVPLQSFALGFGRVGEDSLALLTRRREEHGADRHRVIWPSSLDLGVEFKIMFRAGGVMKKLTLAGEYFLMLLVALNVASVSTGYAQSESFYKGKTLKVLVRTTAGSLL